MEDYPAEVWERQRDGLGIVAAQASLVPLIIDAIVPRVTQLFTREAVRRIPRIYLVGCGDSLYAAMAARLMFERYTGVATEAVAALEFSRYLVDYMTPGSLVIAISVSGGVSRTVEAAEWATRQGGWVVALTGRAESKITQIAQDSIVHYAVLHNDAQRLSTRGLANFEASLIALYLAAVQIGITLGRVDAAEGVRVQQELRAAAAAMDDTIQANTEVTRRYAEEARECETFFLLGAGPNYATAYFGAAKLLEGPNLNGVPQELEEWAHEQYFLTSEGTQVILLAAPGQSIDRAREIVRTVKAVGGRAVVITSPAEVANFGEVDFIFPIMGEIREIYTPLAYALPLEQLAIHLQNIRGSLPAANDAEENYRRQVVRQSIQQSTLRMQ
jgi:glucosamine--fructose-6-phosphate aminotransferase (isomerizing)